MASDYTYVFTDKARGDVDDILYYLVIVKGETTKAQIFLNQLEMAIGQHCQFPDSSPLVENEFLPSFSIRKRLVKTYVLFYLADGERSVIQILRILHEKRDMEKILKDIALL